MNVSKTIPEQVVINDATQIAFFPGSTTVVVYSNDGSGDIQIPVDISTIWDQYSDTHKDGLRDFFRQIVAQAFEVDAIDISGDIVEETP
jgi:hypothetical protein